MRLGYQSLPQIIGAASAEKNDSKAELSDLEIPTGCIASQKMLNHERE